MKKNLVVKIICIIFVAAMVACTALKISAGYCSPSGHCVNVGVEIECDTCKTLKISHLHNRN